MVADLTDPVAGQPGLGPRPAQAIRVLRVAQGQRRSRMRQHVRPLRRRQAGRQPHEHQAGAGRGPDGHRNVETVGQADRQPVAGPQALLGQPFRGALHQLGHLRVGHVALGRLEGQHVGEETYGPVERLDDGAHPTGVAAKVAGRRRLQDQAAGVGRRRRQHGSAVAGRPSDTAPEAPTRRPMLRCSSFTRPWSAA